jgi:hypothetical protein
MTDGNLEAKRDALWRIFHEHLTQFRHYESQRSTIASVLVSLEAVLLSVITFDKSIEASDLPLTIFVIFLGVFGALFSHKQYERSSLQYSRAKVCRDKIDSQIKGAIRAVLVDASKIHDEYFPGKFRPKVHQLWIVLYVLLALLGVILSIIALFAPITPQQ